MRLKYVRTQVSPNGGQVWAGYRRLQGEKDAYTQGMLNMLIKTYVYCSKLNPRYAMYNSQSL